MFASVSDCIQRLAISLCLWLKTFYGQAVALLVVSIADLLCLRSDKSVSVLIGYSLLFCETGCLSGVITFLPSVEFTW